MKAYDVKARKKIKIIDQKVIQLKNTHWAFKGKSSEIQMTGFCMLRKDESQKLKK